MTMSRDAAAYHEAGHAVIAWALGCMVRFTIIDAEGGRCECEDPPEDEGKIVLCFAGPAAQRKHGPGESWHGGGDYGKAAEIALRFGVSDERASKLIDRAHELVAAHWGSIKRVAEALVERGTLQADEIEALLGPPLDRVKLTEQQRRTIIEWASSEGVIEAVRLYGSRAKGFARSHSDIDLAVTTSFGHYVALAKKWEDRLSDAFDLKVHVKQYNSADHTVRGFCDTFSVVLFALDELKW
jgi:predicted nucleotidyltransferase